MLSGFCRHHLVECGMESHVDNAIVHSQLSTFIHICVMCTWHVIRSAVGLFPHNIFSRCCSLRGYQSAFKVMGQNESSTLARTTCKVNPSAGILATQCPIFQELQALFFTKFSLPVDKSPHASHGRSLFDPWQFHSPITGVVTNLQCAAFPLP